MKAILFDLDGTLLPLDEKQFLKHYIGNFTVMCGRKNLPSETSTKALLYGIDIMSKNDGSMSNEDCFWNAFLKAAQMDPNSDHCMFNDYYHTEFLNVKEFVYPTEFADKCVKTAKQKGYRLILATNPLFPKVGTLKRIEWAGLCPDDFEIISTYEDYSYAKPRLEYYNEILDRANLDPKDCLMIGNDVAEDMCTTELGMDTYLVTDHLINKNSEDISKYKNGTLSDCLEYIKSLPTV